MVFWHDRKGLCATGRAVVESLQCVGRWEVVAPPSGASPLRLGTRAPPTSLRIPASGGFRLPQAAPRRADPPASPAAERAFLGAAMLDYPTVAAESRHSAISAADFASPVHSLIWQAIERVGAAGMPVGVVTVAHELAAMGEIDRLDALLRPDTPEGYMVGLWADSWAATGASAWARMIHDYAERRRAIERGAAIVRDAYNGHLPNARGGVPIP